MKKFIKKKKKGCNFYLVKYWTFENSNVDHFWTANSIEYTSLFSLVPCE